MPSLRLSQRPSLWSALAPWFCVLASCTASADELTLVEDGRPRMPLIAGSVAGPVQELRDYLRQMSGAAWEIVRGGEQASGIFVGLTSDFPHLRLPDAAGLGAEGFLIHSDDHNLYLLGETPRGVQHAVSTFLQRLGCRWFFAGDTWTVIPKHSKISGSWHERHQPSFVMQREIWPAYGQNAKCREDWEAWNRHNRMGSVIPIQVQHSGNGLKRDDFERHPEWFALIGNERRPDKPCYTHPSVVERAIEYALERAAEGAPMISMSPADGLGYCECPRCLSVLKQAARPGQPIVEVEGSIHDQIDLDITGRYRAIFGTRPDGTLVSVTSDTFFHFVNQVAAAAARQYPDVQIGCYAYSAYSHPPTFDLYPNVYVQVTTHYRYTPLTLPQQLETWGRRASSLGVREYYSVYQWDWDAPDPGRVRPDRLQTQLREFHKLGVTAVNAEASNNWGPRGLGYYVASQLMWNVEADVPAMIRDFYEQAFGPAALPMQRYYVRWYGPVAQVLPDPLRPPTLEPDEVKDTLENLRGAYDDLSEAARLVRERPAERRRVDELRMYLHYLILRQRLLAAARTADNHDILAAVEAETRFGGRLETTNMIHVRPLIGKRFLDRFRAHRELLTTLPEDNRDAKQWRVYGQPPTHTELETLWHDDGQFLAETTAAP